MRMDWPLEYTEKFGTYVKIGLSRDTDYRKGQLQTGNPFKLTLVKEYAVTTMLVAEEVAHKEAQRHANKATGGGKEWFHVQQGVDPQKLIQEVDKKLT